MSCAMATFAAIFAIFTAASADAPSAQIGADGRDRAPSFDGAAALFHLSSSPSRGDPAAGGDGSDPAALLGSPSTRPSSELEVLLATVPRNRFGRIDSAAARYALHRLFASQRGWRVEGLDPDGQAWNSSSLADVAVLRRLPASDLAKLREGWEQRGLSADEVALLAATIEDLLHEEVSERLRLVFRLSGLPADAEVSVDQAAYMVEIVMSSYIRGQKIGEHNFLIVKNNHKHMSEIFPAWDDLCKWIRDFVADRARTSSSVLSLADASNSMKAIWDAHGMYHSSTTCHDMKSALLNMEDAGTGRVRLPDFYGENVNNGKWQFQESVNYLRMNGALDETNPSNMRVIIPNYVNGLSNCIGASDYHSICCISECEGIRSRVERSLGKTPFATPEEIASAVASLPSATTSARAAMDPVLMLRLQRIAGDSGGFVPVFGRLFAQWLHHAYPRECEFPHLAGKTSPLDVYDMKTTGLEFIAPIKEMKSYAAVKKRRDAPVEGAPWVQQEELFTGEDTASLKVPPLFVAFHTALFVSSALGMVWLARSTLLGLCSKRAGGSARKGSEPFLPHAMV